MLDAPFARAPRPSSASPASRDRLPAARARERRGAARRARGQRRADDLGRGLPQLGPQLDEVALTPRAAAPLRRFGSQGQQRLALLALLFAERDALLDAGRPAPLMLLDDVMSELDPERRERCCSPGSPAAARALITATEPRRSPTAVEWTGSRWPSGAASAPRRALKEAA